MLESTSPPGSNGKRNPRAGKSPAWQRYAADFLADERVACMTTTQVGAYSLLLDYHSREGSIPAALDRIAKLVRLRGFAFQRVWIGTLPECFEPHPDLPDRLVNPRMFRDMQSARKRYQQSRESGATGGRKSAEIRRGSQGCLKGASTSSSSSSSSRVALPPESERNTEINRNAGRPGSRPVRVLGGFEEFWSAWPRKTAKRKARESFARLNPSRELLDQMLEAIARWRTTDQWQRGVIPHPSTWLNGQRWADELPEVTTDDWKAALEAKIRREG